MLKEAETLAAEGFRVSIVTSALPGAGGIPMADPVFCVVRRLNSRSAWLARWRQRLARRSARLWPLQQREAVAAYGSLFTDLVALMRRNPAGALRIMHLEPAFLAADASGHWAGACADFEDWYSEDLLPGRRSAGLTERLLVAERGALDFAAACWCTSEAMADAVANACGTLRRPRVIRNVFPRRMRDRIDGEWKDRPELARRSVSKGARAGRPADVPVSFHWFSQTIGPGRGLEEALSVLAEVKGDWELHLRGGRGNYAAWFEEVCPAPIRSRVYLHGLVPPEELSSRIAEHDVGLACETARPRSRDVTITNKLFQYLQAGLVVLASETAGQREAAALAEGGVLLYQSGGDSLRELMQGLVDDRERLRSLREAAWLAGDRLCWDNEAPKLVSAVREAASGVQKRRVS